MVRSLREVANDCGGIAEAPFGFVSDFLKLGNIALPPYPVTRQPWCRCMPPDLVSTPQRSEGCCAATICPK